MKNDISQFSVLVTGVFHSTIAVAPRAAIVQFHPWLFVVCKHVERVKAVTLNIWLCATALSARKRRYPYADSML